MRFIFDENIPEARRAVLQEEAILALRNYSRERKERNKKPYKMECAVGTLHGRLQGQYIALKWHFTKPDDMNIVIFN